MKSIIVDIDEKEMKELGITSDHISFNELTKHILIKSLREQRNALEKLNIEYGYDKLSEEEIFNMINEDETEYHKKSNDTKCKD